MGVLIPIIVIIIYFVIFSKKSKIQGQKVTTQSKQYEEALARARSTQTVSSSPHRAGNRSIATTPVGRPTSYASDYQSRRHTSSASISALMEDREHDWLANQLKAEHRAFKNTQDMFDLKIEHSSHCDARYLKQTHHSECDANKVDTATGRSS